MNNWIVRNRSVLGRSPQERQRAEGLIQEGHEASLKNDSCPSYSNEVPVAVAQEDLAREMGIGVLDPRGERAEAHPL